MTNQSAAGVRLLKCLAGAALLCAGWMAAPTASVFAEPQIAQWHVSGAGIDGPTCGTSAGDPCKTISYVLLLPAFAAGDQINVTSPITDNVTLAKNVAIAGVAGASIDGSGARIFAVNAGVSAAFSNLTLQNGGGDQDGGAIYNAGTLTINNSTLTQSTLNGANGGAIYNVGVVTITNSIISENSAQYGGGIENQGTVFVSASTIQNNQADYGAGIDNFLGGNVHLTRVILSGNVATASGAGIYNDAGVNTRIWLTDTAVVSNTAQNDAGGIFNSSQLSMSNVTVSNNHVPGGAGVGIAITHQPDPLGAPSSLAAQYVTIAGNTVVNASGAAAVNMTAPTTIKHSVIANSNVANCSGSATSAGYNASSDATCNFISPSDLNNIDVRLGELRLSDLAFGTYTNPLLRNSPLINRIPIALCGIARDQRGETRPQGDGCDIGAHEAVPIDLSLTAASTPASLFAGTPLTVTLNVANAGPAIATGVVVTSDLPAGVGLKDCDPPVTCVVAGNRLTMTLGSVNASATATAIVRLLPQQTGAIAPAFVVAGNEWETQATNNAASVNATVMKSADISIRMDGSLVVPANTTFTVSVSVINNGNFAADAPAFTLTLPAVVSFVQANGNGWVCDVNAGAVSCAAQSPLHAREIMNVIITLQSGSTPAALQLISSATSTTFDPDPSNNTVSIPVTIGTGSRVALPIVLR